MANREELESTVEEVLGKLRSRRLFQSDWDAAALAVFLIFVGTVLLLLLLVCFHCCCHRCCRRSSKPRKEKSMGVRNLALEP